MKGLSLLLGAALFASEGYAEERFYQVIDASGRLQVIKGDVLEDKRDARPELSGSSGTAAVKPGALPEPGGDAKSPASATGSSSEKGEVKAPVKAPYAAYDGGEFVDSEQMDVSHQQQGRDKFYVVSDSAGTRYERISEGDGAVSPLPSSDVTSERAYIELKNDYRLLQDISAVNSGSLCFSEKQVKNGEELQAGKSRDVAFTKGVRGFVRPLAAVQLYRVVGEGFGSLHVRSYAAKDIEPEFVKPLLGFADASGCLTRVVDGYFQRYYEPTVSKHSMLEANLALHAEDAFVILIMPEELKNERGDGYEYRVGSLGRISVKWQR